MTMPPRQIPAARRRLLLITLTLFLTQNLLGSMAAIAATTAGVVPAAGAPASEHPLIDAAANGVPIVDVAPPNSAGVSNNLYTQFNVNGSGLIVNNSTGNVQTQLGGWIAGNPLLGAPAKVIVNQVTAGNPSQLLGAMEVAGQSADLVVANPSGISCNGCSFINTNHATLTTGVPMFGAAGNLAGFDVTQGVLNIGAQGLDASGAERLDLLARGITVGGGIWAQQLGVVTGANTVPYGSTQATPQAGSGAAPEFAVDVSALGGMYANAIDLVATEAGLGVNSQGRLAALQGNLQLSASGNLTLADTYAAKNLNLSGASATLSGLTQSAAGSVQIAAGANLSNTGQIDAASGLHLQAASVGNTGTIVQRDASGAGSLDASGALTNAGMIVSAGALQAQASSVVDSAGGWGAGGALQLQAGSLHLSGSTLQSGAAATLAATAGDLQASNTQISAGGDLNASATGTVANTGGNWQAGGNATLQGNSLANSGVVQAHGTLRATAAGNLNNAGGQLLSTGSLTASGQTVSNDGGAIASNQAVAVSAPDGLSNRDGTISGAAGLSVNAGAGTLNNTAGTLQSGAALTAQAATVTGGGRLLAGGPLSLWAQSIALNDAALQSGAATALTATAGDLQTTNTTIVSSGDLSATATGTLTNTGGSWQSAGQATLAGAAIANSGTVQADNALSATAAGSLDNTGGYLLASGDLTAAGQTIANDGGVLASSQLMAVAAPQGLSNQGGTISGAAGLTVNTGAAALNNATGTLVSGAVASVTAGALSNRGGTIAANQDLRVTSAALDNTAGILGSTTGALALNTQGQALTNASGKIEAAGAAQLTTGNLDNTGGTIAAGGLTLATGALTNGSGAIVSGTTLNANTGAVANTGGLIQAGTDLALNTHGASLSNTASGTTGGIAAGGRLNVQSGAFTNTGGMLASNGDQTLAVQGGLNNSGGSITTLGNLDAIASGAIGNQGGTIDAGGTATLGAAALDNTAQAGGTAGSISAQNLVLNATTLANAGGSVQAGQDATLTTASLDNTSGTVSAQRNLTVSANSLANTAGTLVGNASATVNTASTSPGGTITSHGNVTLNDSGAFVNAGLLSAGGDLSLNAASITNTATGTLSALGHLTAATPGDLRNDGTIDAAGSATLNVGAALTNTGLIDSGGATAIQAGSLSNTGRIYGNWVSIAAGTLDNAGPGSIASRGDLQIAANTLNNTAGATILALGNLELAGSFDGSGNATSAMGSLLNASSTIQSGGDMGIVATQVVNRNDGLVLGSQTTSQTLGDIKVQALSGSLSAVSPVYDASQLGQAPSQWNGQTTWVLPSATYPIAVFGAVAITPEIVTNCTGGDSPICTTSYTYANTDPVWARFGVTPPPAPPQPPSGMPTVYGYDPTTGNYGPMPPCTDAYGGMITTGACGTYWQQVQADDILTAQAESALDHAITAFNTDVTNRQMYAYEQFNLTNQSTTSTTVVSTDPAKISSGGNLTITGGGAGSVVNDNSAIVAGGALNVASGSLDNQSALGTRTVTQTGSYGIYKFQYHGGFSDSYSFDYKGGGAYDPAPVVTPIDLNTVTVAQNAGGGGVAAPAATQATVSNASALAGVHPIAMQPRPVSLVGVAAPAQVGQAAVHAPPALQQVTVPAAAGGPATVVSTSPPALRLPTSQLFKVQSAPAAPYLVETDPAFTNQQTFLSSNYYLQALNVNPANALKRYGDGFAEQQLVQNQILALTGRNILSGYANTQNEYTALMNAGVVFAKQYGIAPGVSLSPEQMALVTTDMVLLTTQTVTLPDGATQQVLVPQVYLAHPQGQDLMQGGALIAGGTVTLTTAQDLVNSGTVQGDTVAASAGHDLVNQGGVIRGGQVLLSAGNDLKNLSGLIAGTGDTSTLNLLAGRDIVLQTQTTGSSNAMSSRSSLGTVATVQGGNVTLQAARDLVANGAQIVASQNLSGLAGRNIVIGATTTQYQLDTGGDNSPVRTNFVQETTTTQHGSVVSAGGNATLVAQGGDLSVNASSVSAAGDATLAGQNVTIASGVNTNSRHIQATWGNSYVNVATRGETAATASVSASNNLVVQATGNGQPGSGDLTVTGAQLDAQNGQATLAASHDISVGTLATTQTSVSQRQSQSSGLFGHSSATDQANSASTAQRASAVTGNTVTVSSGHDLTVTGSAISGTGAATGQVDLTVGNNLNIVAAAVSQSAHSQGQSSGGTFGRKSDSTTDLSQTTAQASRISGTAIQLQSGADMTLQAAQIQGNSLTAQAGAIDGQLVNPSAQLHIDAAINSLSQSSHSSGHDLLTQSTAGKGDIQQTLQYTTIRVPGAAKPGGSVQLQATGGITVGASGLTPASTTDAGGTGASPPVLTVDLQQQAQQLASQPGLAYMAQLASRNDVAWQQVQLASQHWNYSASGLSGVGAAIVAIAVAVCTAGTGAALVGALATSAGGAMASAAFTSLVTQAAISLADNGGNIGQTLHDLGSSASVRALATSVATAGLTNVQLAGGESLNQMAGLSNLGDTGRSLASGSVSSSTVEGIAGRAVVNAGVGTALEGTSFTQGLVNSAVADGSALGANAIGSTWGSTGTDPNAGLQTLAHGTLGCAEAGLTGGDCAAGAAGAAAESVLGHVVTASGGLSTEANGNVSTAAAATYETGAAVLGALAGQAAGGDAQSGVNTAVNSAANNYMAHTGDYVKALNACQQNPSGAGCGTILKMSQGAGVPLGQTPSGYAVAANVGADGTPTSYVVTSPSGRQMILQPQEWGAFSAMSPGQQAAVFSAPQWSLDLTSTMVYAGNGDYAGAASNYGHMLSGLSYWGSLGAGLAMGTLGTLATLPETAGLGVVKGGIGANSTSGSVPMINGVTVINRATGNVYQGTVDLQPTLDRIAAGVKYPSRNDGTTFSNNEGLLPQQPAGYYTEHVVPTPEVNGVGPQRLVTGQNGEVYYTPDHYKTFIPVKR